MKRKLAAIACALAFLAASSSAARAESRSKSDLEKEYRSASYRAVGRDAFPVLFNPPMGSVEEGDRFMRPNDWVIGIEIDGEANAYPVTVMGFHELINDVVAGKPITVCW